MCSNIYHTLLQKHRQEYKSHVPRVHTHELVVPRGILMQSYCTPWYTHMSQLYTLWYTSRELVVPCGTLKAGSQYTLERALRPEVHTK